MNFSTNSDEFIDAAQLLPFPDIDSVSISPKNSAPPTLGPLSMNLTEFHILLLYKDRLLGICNLNDALVYEEALPLVRILFIVCTIYSYFSNRNQMRKYEESLPTPFERHTGSTRTLRCSNSLHQTKLGTSGKCILRKENMRSHFDLRRSDMPVHFI